MKYDPDRFGKHGFKPTRRKDVRAINVGKLDEQSDLLLERKQATKTKTGIKIHLTPLGYNKLLAKGQVTHPLIVQADAWTPSAAKKIAEESEFGLILMSDKVDVLKAAVGVCAFKKPLLYAAIADNAEDMGNLAKETGLPLAVKADNVEDLIGLSDKLTGMGLKDLVLDSGSREMKQVFEDLPE